MSQSTLRDVSFLNFFKKSCFKLRRAPLNEFFKKETSDFYSVIWLLLESALRSLKSLFCWQVSSTIKEATMTLDKLVIKCGNFAVLVDFHIASQDRMWFSDHQREEVCLLLKDTVESRVQQYLKARKLHGRCKQTEHGEANSLSLRADEFHISAYFVKRWANLRCIGQRHGELRVFPDRFVIYVSRFEPDPSSWVKESVALEENLFTKVSEYFQGSAEDRKCQISLTQQEKQDTLKKLMKRATHANKKKPQPRVATTKVYLGSPDSDTE